MVWHAGLLHKLKSYQISGQIFGLISSFLSNRWASSGSGWKVFTMLEFLKAPFLVLNLSFHKIMTSHFICDIAIYVDDTTLYSKCDQAYNLWQEFELASELESDLRDTVDWGKKWIVVINAGKTQLALFHRSNNNGSIDVKMDGSVFEEKSSFKMLGLNFSSKLDWGSYIISIAKTASKKIGA